TRPGDTQTGATEHGATAASTTRVGDTVIQRPRRTGALDHVVFASRSAARALGSAGRIAFGWLIDTVPVAGWLLLVVLLVGIVVGAAFGLVEGWVIAVVAAVLLCFSVPFLLGGANLDVAFALGQDRVVAGSEVDATITVANRSRRVSLPVVLDVPVGPGLVEAYVPLLVGRAQHVERLRIAAPRRGIIRVGPMQFTRGDPIGILRREIGWPQVEEIFVHPVTSRLPSTSAGFV